MKTFTSLFSMMFILLSAFLLDTANAQLSTENILRAPFVSAQNLQQSPQSIMQNSEKDIVFIENLGQIRDSKGNKRPDVLFLTRSQGVDMYITSSGITYVFRKTELDLLRKVETDEVKTTCYRLDMEFVGMNKNINIKKELTVEQQFNYYTPEYPNGISPKAYKKITVENIYEGINLVYYEKEGKMKYNFIIKTGANIDKIKMKYKGAGNVYINKDGSVIVTTQMGEIREEKPYTYSRSTGLEIESGYKINENVVQFEIAEYNKSEDIIIDPYRIWATYYGGNISDVGYSIYTDNSGNIYATGYISSSIFPTQILPGAYNQTWAGNRDVFILKFNSNDTIMWATHYGGGGNDYGNSIYTDNSGNIYVTGHTISFNFPTQILPGAYNQTILCDSSYEAFILKFNNNGVRLWATYYGGSGYDAGHGICTDNSSNLYVTGWTYNSINFPTQILPGAYNQTAGSNDAFILKFNSSDTIIWATYYGGSFEDNGRSICIDNSNNLYVTGKTSSTNFPTQTLIGAYNQATYGGDYSDAFILKFNSSCARLWATYYGGNYDDGGISICTDNSGNLYVTGSSNSANFPTQILPGAYNQTTYAGGLDAFILKFNGSDTIIWATYYGGGSGYDAGRSICTDNSGNLYITGKTLSTNFPIQTLDSAYNQTTHGGLDDAFILKFNSSCARLWATYYGGSGRDEGIGICSDTSGYLYVTGKTYSTNFPTQTLTGAYNQTTSGGVRDAFILKFSPTPVVIKNISNEVPTKYSLHQNYPNPFNPTTSIRFDLHKSTHAKMIVYDILGKEVATLVNEKLSAGRYEVEWNASGYPSGVYFYRLETDEFVDIKKMIFLK